MNLPNLLTASRIFLAPVFFVLFMYGSAMGLPAKLVVPALWVLLIIIELTDLFDGMAARKLKIVSGFGKLFDPFTDVLARITYFVCFAWVGIMPLWILVIILYREFGINFLRMLLVERGIAMGARSGGKLKAVVYVVAGLVSLLVWSLMQFSMEVPRALSIFVTLSYVLAAILSVSSFLDYVNQFRKYRAKA
ncbi:MAG TPA: CDP-diacylglycerol--glycerol-3-phosphate 3-phosphatidyltransferase [Spirochaetaceae bacterium]|nr:CDP-diacylglycerol--glycerol-3-phosphate 3-phosphatidyltransferase [Spirochaetaceae bacterium]